jgi:hypothetical protein
MRRLGRLDGRVVVKLIVIFLDNLRKPSASASRHQRQAISSEFIENQIVFQFLRDCRIVMGVVYDELLSFDEKFLNFLLRARRGLQLRLTQLALFFHFLAVDNPMRVTPNKLNDFDGIKIVDILQHRRGYFIEVGLIEFCSHNLVRLIGVEMNAQAVKQILEKLLHFEEISSLHIDRWNRKDRKFLL